LCGKWKEEVRLCQRFRPNHHNVVGEPVALRILLQYHRNTTAVLCHFD